MKYLLSRDYNIYSKHLININLGLNISIINSFLKFHIDTFFPELRFIFIRKGEIKKSKWLQLE